MAFINDMHPLVGPRAVAASHYPLPKPLHNAFQRLAAAAIAFLAPLTDRSDCEPHRQSGPLP
ncbi:hypothetical protein [Blastomonas sp.]|uniref:hypothetical protein n=1 Tax=Blastomonas sp. TaxID=1909299 RepID=UPI00406A84AA